MAINAHISAAGNPAGLRISFPALSIAITLLLAVGAFVGGLRRSDLSSINSAISIVRASQLAESERTIAAANAVRAIQAADLLRLERRLERIEDKLDKMVLVPR